MPRRRPKLKIIFSRASFWCSRRRDGFRYWMGNINHRLNNNNIIDWTQRANFFYQHTIGSCWITVMLYACFSLLFMSHVFFCEWSLVFLWNLTSFRFPFSLYLERKCLMAHFFKPGEWTEVVEVCHFVRFKRDLW